MHLDQLHDAVFNHFDSDSSRDVCFSLPLTLGKRATLQLPITELRAPDPKFNSGSYCTAFQWRDEMRLSVVHIPDDHESISIIWTEFPGWRTCANPAIITEHGSNGSDDDDSRIAFAAYAYADAMGAFE